MKNKLSGMQSSYIVSWPVIGLFFAAGIFCAFKHFIFPAAILIILSIAALVSRLWAKYSLDKLTVTAFNDVHGLFPGDKLHTKLKISNGKFLPVLWLTLNCVLEADPVLMPQDCEITENSELIDAEKGVRRFYKIAQIRLPSLLWYEKNEKVISWEAMHRGIYATGTWTANSGDGLGLSQLEMEIIGASREIFAVYPKLVPVSPAIFLRNINNGETGARGITKDVTLIRSSRLYDPASNARHINWRLAARGLPLQVNIYEEILPGNVHFIIDGESFAGEKDALEEMLSIIASEIIAITEKNAKCGVSICSGENVGSVHLFAGECTMEDILFALAAYKNLPAKYDEGNKILIRQRPDFDMDTFLEKQSMIGRTYYVAYDRDTISNLDVYSQLELDRTSFILTNEKIIEGYEVITLDSLKEGEVI